MDDWKGLLGYKAYYNAEPVSFRIKTDSGKTVVMEDAKVEVEQQDPIMRLRGFLEGTDALVCAETVLMYLDEIEAAYMKLPVDADGVPIHIGDILEETQNNGDIERFTVHGYTTEYLIWTDFDLPLMATDEDATEYYCDRCRHVKPDTVEKLLKELMQETVDWCHYSGPMSGTRTQQEITADYAERIREVMQDGDD